MRILLRFASRKGKKKKSKSTFDRVKVGLTDLDWVKVGVLCIKGGGGLIFLTHTHPTQRERREEREREERERRGVEEFNFSSDLQIKVSNSYSSST